MMKKDSCVLTIKQAAGEFCFPEVALRTLIKEGKIPVIQVGNRVYITRKVFEEYLAKGGEPYGE